MTTKIVRDFAKDRYPSDKYFTVSGSTKRVFLLKKMHEEIEEVARDPNDILEYADVLEILLELASEFGYTLEQIDHYRKQKAKVKGGFKAGLVWDEPCEAKVLTK